jgi:hypothetical protein
MRPELKKTLVFLAACMLPVFASCKPAPFTVNLQPAYAGPVNITCDTSGSTSGSVQIDQTGSAEASVCPLHPTDIVIIRAGRPVRPEADPAWETTGDNIPVGIHFTVR